MNNQLHYQYMKEKLFEYYKEIPKKLVVKKINCILFHNKDLSMESKISILFQDHLHKLFKKYWQNFKKEIPRLSFVEFLPPHFKRKCTFLESNLSFTFHFSINSKKLVLKRDFMRQTQALHILIFLKKFKLSLPRKLIQYILEI